jgi:hypothetical protein
MAPPCYRPCRVSRGRKAIRRGRCAFDRAIRSLRSVRHPRASDGLMVVGAARPAIRDREPAGGRRKYRTEAVAHALPDGYMLLLVAASNAINATLYDKLSFVFLRDIAPVAGASSACSSRPPRRACSTPPFFCSIPPLTKHLTGREPWASTAVAHTNKRPRGGAGPNSMKTAKTTPDRQGQHSEPP